MDDIFLRPIVEFTEELLDDLIRDEINESIQLDYKREVGGPKELAKDVSAFANTKGGILIYGIETDKNDIPIRKFPLTKTKKLKESIENKINTSIYPRINDILIKVIPDKTDITKCYIVIKIHPSADSPHYVTKSGDRRFYKRYNFQSIPMDEYEIESSYQQRFDHKQSFKEQLNSITQELLQLEYEGHKRLFCVSLPLRFGNFMYDMEDISEEKGLLIEKGLRTIGGHSNPCYDKDGYFDENEYGRIGFTEKGSIMLSRPLMLKPDEVIPSSSLISNIYAYLQTMIFLYGKKGFFGQFVIQISLTDMEGMIWPIPGWIVEHSKPCITNFIQLTFQGSIAYISDDKNNRLFIENIIKKIVGYFGLPPNIGIRSVDIVAQRGWRK